MDMVESCEKNYCLKNAEKVLKTVWGTV